MGVISVLKNALGAVGDFDQRMSYGPKYKEKMAVLSRLNEIEMRGKLLENEDKFARIQKMRQDIAQQERQQRAAAFKAAQQFGAAQDSTVDPAFVGPRLDEADLPNPTEEGFVQPTIPSFLAEDVDPQDQEALLRATVQARGQRRQGEDRALKLFSSQLKASDALAEQRESSADKNDRWTGGGAGGHKRVRSSTQGWKNTPEGPVFGANITFDDGEVIFRPYEGGASPLYGIEPSQGDRNAFIGAGSSYSDLDNVLTNFEKADAKGLLGPVVGRASEFSVKYLGGAGLSEEDRALIQSLDRARTMAAFAEGGKQLTGTEKEYFDLNYPRLQSTTDPKVFIRLAREIQGVIKRNAEKRRSLISPVRRPTDEQFNQLFSTPGTAPAGPGPGATPKAAPPPGWRIGSDGVLERIQ